jgi:predicted nucleic acid binding AN1-type Zn finger protein
MVINCETTNCNNKILKIIGYCKACDNTFCYKHRYPESHFCPKLSEIRLTYKQQLINKLHNDSVQSNKITKI